MDRSRQLNKFKLKKLKATKLERNIIFFLLFCISFIYLIFPAQSSDSILEKKSIDEFISDYLFEGEMVSKTVFEDKFVSLIYLNNNEYENYFLDYTNEKEVNLNALFKKEKLDDFENKINELLHLKYPDNLADDIFKTASIKYFFTDTYLQVYFSNVISTLSQNTDFTLKVFYNEVNEYLKFNPKLFLEYENEDGFNYDPSKVTIAFTFDDGPYSITTNKILDILEKYKMSATFFVVANKILYEQNTLKKVYDSHSEVGYHSLNHQDFKTQSKDAITSEYNYSNSLFSSITKDSFSLTRPPYGSYNQNALDAINTSFIMWNVDTNDWKYRDKEHIVKHVLENYNDGDIILFHDIYESTAEAVLELVPILYAKDVQVVSVSTLAKLKGINLNKKEVYYNFN